MTGPRDAWADQRRLPPEGGIAGPPVIEELPAGTRLWRIHSIARSAEAFVCGPPSAHAGGRFDAVAATYGHLYAADSFEGAVAETFVRRLPLVDDGERLLPFARVAGRSVSVLEMCRELRVVILHGAAAAAVGQGLWLTKCEAADYPLTIEWGRALRACAPECAGLAWRARFDEDRLSYVLYSDLAEGALEPVWSTRIDEGPGLEAVRRALLEHRVAIER